MTKDEYILNRLSRLTHKKWELFIVTRIFHLLDDPTIEFVCQQYVRREGGARALTDLYFPQFGVHLEIDEGQHANEENQIRDLLRSQDIIEATGHSIRRIKVYTEGGKTLRPLQEISLDTDCFVAQILEKKAAAVDAGSFVPWDFETRYSPEIHIRRGFINVSENVVFKYQHDALRCFGFSGKNYQRGAWKLKDGSERGVWFPRLFRDKDWDNSLSEDGLTIVEQRFSSLPIDERFTDYYRERFSSRIVFARHKDDLGAVLYRFIGEFELDLDASSAGKGVFRRTDTHVELESSYDPNKKFGAELHTKFSKQVTKGINDGSLSLWR